MKSNEKFALLFDLDGTMADTDHLHLEAYNILLSKEQRTVTEEYYKSNIMGFSDDIIMSGLFPENSKDTNYDLSEKKEKIFRSILNKIAPTPGLIKVLEWAQNNNVSVAVVTNAPKENALLMLTELKLINRFNVIVLGQELAKGKPHPLPYLTALDKLGISAERAFAFEDSLSGIRSASQAGIKTFGVSTSLPEKTLISEGASHVIEDFNNKTLWKLMEENLTIAEPHSQ